MGEKVQNNVSGDDRMRSLTQGMNLKLDGIDCENPLYFSSASFFLNHSLLLLLQSLKMYE